MKYDLLLIHAPSYYYFRESKRSYGPIADVVPSTPIFDMYPYGFFSLAHYLSKRGYKVGIHNSAALMVMDEDYRLEEYLGGIDAELYGIDLHWLVHAHGALEAAKVIKRVKGDVPVVVGGLSSSIFWAEILFKYEQIDYVVLGDTTEKTMQDLIDYIEGEKEISDVRGLAYRADGRIRLNSPQRPEVSLDEYAVDFEYLFKRVLSLGDPLSFIPYSSFLRNPIGAVLSFKGCVFSCATCGGGRKAYREYLGRDNISYKSPEVLAEEILSINSWSRIPIFIIGDLQLIGGIKYVTELRKKLNERGLDSPLYFEFFTPPPRPLLEEILRTAPQVYLQISPETQDERLRNMFGRPYTNGMLERFLATARDMGFERVDLYFMHGLPFQTYEIALGLSRYVGRLYDIWMKEGLDVFVAPLAPFIDPGSPAFTAPQIYGYRLRAKTLEEHVRLIEGSSTWIEMLNYESNFMTREELLMATARTAIDILEIKIRRGVIGEDIGRKQIEIIKNYIDNFRNYGKIDEKIIVPFDELYETMDIGRLLRNPEEVAKILINITKLG